jgi:hypothetical protein
MSSTTIQTGSERPVLTTLVKALLACGIVSSLVYLGADALGSLSFPGYVYANQAVSELMALEAPTRSMMLALMSVYNVLVIAFAIGVWRMAEGKRALKAAAVALFVYSVVGEVTQLFSPMHPRGFSATVTATDVGHIVLTAVEVLSIVAMIALASGARGNGFRAYSVLSILAIMAAGITTGTIVQHMTAAASSTPWAGLVERVNIYGTMLWVAALAVALLRTRMGEAAPRRAAIPAIATRGISMMSVR